MLEAVSDTDSTPDLVDFERETAFRASEAECEACRIRKRARITLQNRDNQRLRRTKTLGQRCTLNLPCIVHEPASIVADR